MSVNSLQPNLIMQYSGLIHRRFGVKKRIRNGNCSLEDEPQEHSPNQEAAEEVSAAS